VKGDLVSFGARRGGGGGADGGMEVDGEGGAGAGVGSMALIRNTLVYAKELERIV
jgi:hypothetical protein